MVVVFDTRVLKNNTKKTTTNCYFGFYGNFCRLLYPLQNPLSSVSKLNMYNIYFLINVYYEKLDICHASWHSKKKKKKHYYSVVTFWKRSTKMFNKTFKFKTT